LVSSWSINALRTRPLFILLYLALCALPLALALLGPLPAFRGPWVEFGVVLGFVGLGMMGVQFALTARFPTLSRRLGQDKLLRFHKYAGFIAAAFVFAHPVVLILAQPDFASFFDPRVNLMRAGALTAANAALVSLILLTVLRRQMGLSYEWWRLTHGILAAMLLLISIAHVLNIRHYISTPVQTVLFVVLIGVPLGLLVHVRLLRPWLARRCPYVVAEVRRERDRVWTVVLQPVGHAPLRFEAGQFAWLTFGDSPFALRQHPFTIASSAARPERIEFTIKELGDFTRTVSSIRPGSTAFVEGPAGDFVVPRGAAGVVLISGGIGITPAISILRTLRDRADRTPVTLFYGNDTIEKAVFADELDRLCGELDLRVVHIPEQPPEGWTGPKGYITKETIEEHVPPEERRKRHFFICGPDPMIGLAERALRALGVPRTHIRSERFNIV